PSADDGVLLANEIGDIVSDNIMFDLFDAGIETTGYIHDTTFSGNRITTFSLACIGSWFPDGTTKLSWQGNTVSDNVCDSGTDSSSMFVFFQGQSDWVSDFKNNQFSHNHERQRPWAPRYASRFQFSDDLGGEVVNNTFVGNEFDTGGTDAVLFGPSTGFANGGGNACDYSYANPIGCSRAASEPPTPIVKFNGVYGRSIFPA